MADGDFFSQLTGFLPQPQPAAPEDNRTKAMGHLKNLGIDPGSEEGKLLSGLYDINMQAAGDDPYKKGGIGTGLLAGGFAGVSNALMRRGGMNAAQAFDASQAGPNAYAQTQMHMADARRQGLSTFGGEAFKLQAGVLAEKRKKQEEAKQRAMELRVQGYPVPAELAAEAGMTTGKPVAAQPVAQPIQQPPQQQQLPPMVPPPSSGGQQSQAAPQLPQGVSIGNQPSPGVAAGATAAPAQVPPGWSPSMAQGTTPPVAVQPGQQPPVPAAQYDPSTGARIGNTVQGNSGMPTKAGFEHRYGEPQLQWTPSQIGLMDAINPKRAEGMRKDNDTAIKLAELTRNQTEEQKLKAQTDTEIMKEIHGDRQHATDASTIIKNIENLIEQGKDPKIRWSPDSAVGQFVGTKEAHGVSDLGSATVGGMLRGAKAMYNPQHSDMDNELRKYMEQLQAMGTASAVQAAGGRGNQFLERMGKAISGFDPSTSQKWFGPGGFEERLGPVRSLLQFQAQRSEVWDKASNNGQDPAAGAKAVRDFDARATQGVLDSKSPVLNAGQDRQVRGAMSGQPHAAAPGAPSFTPEQQQIIEQAKSLPPEERAKFEEGILKLWRSGPPTTPQPAPATPKAASPAPATTAPAGADPRGYWDKTERELAPDRRAYLDDQARRAEAEAKKPEAPARVHTRGQRPGLTEDERRAYMELVK